MNEKPTLGLFEATSEGLSAKKIWYMKKKIIFAINK